jgi:hypothetical protein
MTTDKEAPCKTNHRLTTHSTTLTLRLTRKLKRQNEGRDYIQTYCRNSTMMMMMKLQGTPSRHSPCQIHEASTSNITYTCECVYIYLCIYIYICMCVYIYLCVYTYILVCMCVYIYIRACHNFTPAPWWVGLLVWEQIKAPLPSLHWIVTGLYEVNNTRANDKVVCPTRCLVLICMSTKQPLREAHIWNPLWNATTICNHGSSLITPFNVYCPQFCVRACVYIYIHITDYCHYHYGMLPNSFQELTVCVRPFYFC